MPQEPKTVNSNLEPYADASDLFDYHDWTMVADNLRDGTDARPAKADLENPASAPYGVRLYRILKSASGKVESACLVKKMYTPEDLAELIRIDEDTGEYVGGNSAETLVKLVCDLAFYQSSQRKQPNSGDPKNVPGAVEALELLDRLRDGERIFSFQETQNAGLPSVVTPEPTALVTPNVVGRTRRVYGNYGMNRGNGGGDN